MPWMVELIKHGRELTAVLGTVDVDRRCTQNWHRLAMSIRYYRWGNDWMIRDTLSMKKTMRLVSI